eukprot:gene14674-16201_t
MYCKELASEAGISAKAMTTRPEADQGWQVQATKTYYKQLCCNLKQDIREYGVAYVVSKKEVFGVRLSWRETKKKARRAAGTGGGARGAGRTGAEQEEQEEQEKVLKVKLRKRAAGVFPVAGRDREAEGGGKTEGKRALVELQEKKKRMEEERLT